VAAELVVKVEAVMGFGLLLDLSTSIVVARVMAVLI
jgi:hypothetical protein